MNIIGLLVMLSLVVLTYICTQAINAYFGKQKLQQQYDFLLEEYDDLQEQIHELNKELVEAQQAIEDANTKFRNFAADAETSINGLEARLVNRLVRLEGATGNLLHND